MRQTGKRYTMADLRGDVQRISRRMGKIMSKLDDANAKLDELQETVDADQAQDAATIAAMQVEIDALKAAAANGLSPAEVDGLITRLDAIKADVAGPNA